MFFVMSQIGSQTIIHRCKIFVVREVFSAVLNFAHHPAELLEVFVCHFIRTRWKENKKSIFNGKIKKPSGQQLKKIDGKYIRFLNDLRQSRNVFRFEDPRCPYGHPRRSYAHSRRSYAQPRRCHDNHEKEIL
jgi:hypothetical protein